MFKRIPFILSTPIKRHFSASVLRDNFNRGHNYLRISITERCNLRCSYCMPKEGIKLASREKYLTLPELKRLSSIFVNLCGVDKVRLTGGEPTVRESELESLLKHLNDLRQNGRLETLAMTTNGLTLKRKAKYYRSLGLNAINISLDTLKEDKFEHLTGVKGFKLAYQGLMTAIECDFDKVKLNCVIVKDFNEDEIEDFVELARKYPIEVRFIEFMPFAGNEWATKRMVPYKEMLQIVQKSYPNLKKLTSLRNETSKVYNDEKMLGSVGFISSISDNFCSDCNRLRITADGNLKVCLFGREETSLRDLIRNGATDLEIKKVIETSLKGKKKQHAGATNLMLETMRPMVKIGSRMFHSSASELSHLDAKGRAQMVNVGEKQIMKRTASASGRIHVGQEVLDKLETLSKGDVITVAKVAGILAAKQTSNFIPMCHQIQLNHVDIKIVSCNNSKSLIVTSIVEATNRTGVEMESLTAVTVTLLTLYDMCKSVNKSMIISDVKLLSKIKV